MYIYIYTHIITTLPQFVFFIWCFAFSQKLFDSRVRKSCGNPQVFPYIPHSTPTRTIYAHLTRPTKKQSQLFDSSIMSKESIFMVGSWQFDDSIMTIVFPYEPSIFSSESDPTQPRCRAHCKASSTFFLVFTLQCLMHSSHEPWKINRFPFDTIWLIIVFSWPGALW